MSFRHIRRVTVAIDRALEAEMERAYRRWVGGFGRKEAREALGDSYDDYDDTAYLSWRNSQDGKG